MLRNQYFASGKMENGAIFKSCFERGYSVYKVDVFPEKDTKLLTKLLRTRAVYDQTRCEILANSLTGINKGKSKAKKNNLSDFQKVKAIVNLVTSVDKGADLSKMMKTAKPKCCNRPKSGPKPKSPTRSRNKGTQKSCCDHDKKVHRISSDPCKMSVVQRNRCQTTCIQVQMVENCPKQNLQTLLCQMCKPVKIKPCKTQPVKPITNNCSHKISVKTKNACTKTCSSKTRTTKSEANVKVKKCVSHSRRDWTQNSLIVNFLGKRGSHKCCKASKPDVTQVTNIFCCNKTKPCSTHVVEHRSEHKKSSQVKIHLKKKGTQPLVKPCCAVQWKPNKEKSCRSLPSKASSGKKGKKGKAPKKQSPKKCAKKPPTPPKPALCKCDKNVQTKCCKKHSKNNKGKKNMLCHNSTCSCCKTCKNNRFYHSVLKEIKGCTDQIVRSYSVICKTTRPPCCPKKPQKQAICKSIKVNTVKSPTKLKKVQSSDKKKKEIKCPPPPHPQPEKFKPIRRGLRLCSNCCIDIELYRERPKEKPKPKVEKAPPEKVKKVNKGTKTRPQCCSLCYFVEIYRRKPESNFSNSSSTGSLTSSALSSDCDSTCSSSIEDVRYRTLTFDEYSPPCKKLLAVDNRKSSEFRIQNDIFAHGTRLTKNMLQRGLFTKFYSATTLDEERQIKLLKNHCVEKKHNVFFRKLGHELFRDITAFVYLPDALYATEQKFKDFLSKNDIIKCGVSCFSKCCNRAWLILIKEIGSLRVSLQTYCRILFWA